MVPIELSEEMAEMMREVLVSHLSELRMEIAYTNRKEMILRKRRGRGKSGRNDFAVGRL